MLICEAIDWSVCFHVCRPEQLAAEAASSVSSKPKTLSFVNWIVSSSSV